MQKSHLRRRRDTAAATLNGFYSVLRRLDAFYAGSNISTAGGGALVAEASISFGGNEVAAGWVVPYCAPRRSDAVFRSLRPRRVFRWSSFTAFYPVGTGVMTQGDAVLQAGKVASLIPGIGLSCQEFPCSPRGFLPVTRLHSHSPKTCIVIVWDVTPPLPKGSWDHGGRIDALAVSRQSSYNLHRPCADWWHRTQFKWAPLLSLFRLSWVSRDFFSLFAVEWNKEADRQVRWQELRTVVLPSVRLFM